MLTVWLKYKLNLCLQFDPIINWKYDYNLTQAVNRNDLYSQVKTEPMFTVWLINVDGMTLHFFVAGEDFLFFSYHFTLSNPLRLWGFIALIVVKG